MVQVCPHSLVWCYNGPGVSPQFGVDCYNGPGVSPQFGVEVLQWSRCVRTVWCGDVTMIQVCPHSLVWRCYNDPGVAVGKSFNFCTSGPGFESAWSFFF